MQRLELDKDIHSISELRSNATSFIKQVHQTRRPLVITQNGKSAAVLIDVIEYEKILEKIELLEDINTAEKQIDDGLGDEHDIALQNVLEKINT